jgi:hypothetical protein
MDAIVVEVARVDRTKKITNSKPIPHIPLRAKLQTVETGNYPAIG